MGLWEVFGLVDNGKQHIAEEEGGEGAVAPNSAQVLDELTQAVAAEKARADANMAGWQRSAADLANYRKRAEQERSELVKNAYADLLRRLLPVVDDMERAWKTTPADLAGLPWVEGMRLIDRKLHTLLEQDGVTAYDSLGQNFDPAIHDAIMMEDVEPENDGKVVGEILRGYRWQDRVLRPALVKVGRGRKEQA
jgi:molecular chaperone GrpE